MKKIFRLVLISSMGLAGLAVTQLSNALDVRLESNREYVEVVHKGKLVRVQRIQDQQHVLTGSFAKTSRKCPPFCIQPMLVEPGVMTVAEPFIFDFMENDMVDGTGLIIDARIPAWHKKGTIPGSVNIPFTVFEKSETSRELRQALSTLGVTKRDDVGSVTRAFEAMGFNDGDLKNDNWDFSEAKKIILWCNGPWCDQSPRAIRALLEMGYPADRLFYYRGGMQMWQIFGLVTILG